MTIRRLLHRTAVPLLWQTGALSAMHAVRNRRSLTVFGLHRVLAEDDPRMRCAMPEWTVTTRLFRGLMNHIAREYNVVSADAVIRATDSPLPPRAALITFDDGWSDTADTALPIMRELGLPGLVFVVSGRVDQPHAFWEAEWYAAWQAAARPERRQAWMRVLPEQCLPADLDTAIHPILDALTRVPLQQRLSMLGELMGGPVSHGGPLMVSRGDIGTMLRGGFEIGAHSVNHEPLARVAEGVSEIRQSMDDLNALVAEHGSRVRTFSYPHGSYTRELVRTAQEAGARLQFTSDLCLNTVRRGAPAGHLLGRVWGGRRLADAIGNLDPAEAAFDFSLYPMGLDREAEIG